MCAQSAAQSFDFEFEITAVRFECEAGLLRCCCRPERRSPRKEPSVRCQSFRSYAAEAQTGFRQDKPRQEYRQVTITSSRSQLASDTSGFFRPGMVNGQQCSAPDKRAITIRLKMPFSCRPGSDSTGCFGHPPSYLQTLSFPNFQKSEPFSMSGL